MKKFRQESRGRPAPNTLYVRETTSRFALEYRIDSEYNSPRKCVDGVFP